MECLSLLVSRKIKYRTQNAVMVQKYVRMYLAFQKHRPRSVHERRIRLYERWLRMFSFLYVMRLSVLMIMYCNSDSTILQVSRRFKSSQAEVQNSRLDGNW